MRKYHASNLGDVVVSDDIAFSQSLTPREFLEVFGQEWDSGRIIALGDSAMEYVAEIDGSFLITGLNEGNIDIWTATRFLDIEGYVWESDLYMAIEKGREVYAELATSSGVDADEALANMPAMLTAGWSPNELLIQLGADDISAIIEARAHFSLPPFE